MTELSCPKCHGLMRQYERSGVLVDQCTDCRGIFLDRGELERLSEAETRWHGGTGTPPPVHGGPSGYTQHRGSDDRHGYGRPYGYGKKRKRSFLEDLFD
jgi:uncharacterized protein